MVTFFHARMPRGIGETISTLKMAEIIIPTSEIVMILPVKIGKLNDKIEKLNLFPPKNIGSQPSINSNKAAVAQDQNPSITVYKCEIFCQKGIFLFCKNPNIIY